MFPRRMSCPRDPQADSDPPGHRKLEVLKAPQLRGFQDLKFAMTRWIAVSLRIARATHPSRKHSPLFAPSTSRVFTSINSLRLERWGHTPAEPQGLRVS